MIINKQIKEKNTLIAINLFLIIILFSPIRLHTSEIRKFNYKVFLKNKSLNLNARHSFS